MSHFRAAYSIWFYLEHLKNQNCPIQVNLIRFLSLIDYVFMKTRYLHQRDVFRRPSNAGASNSLNSGGLGHGPLAFLAIQLKQLRAFQLLLPSFESFGIFWNILESFGFFWNLLESFGLLWILLEFLGFFWNLMEYFGFFCNVLDLFGFFLILLEFLGIF